MEKYANSFPSFLNFIFKIIPMMREQAKIAGSTQKLCMPALFPAAGINAANGNSDIAVQYNRQSGPENFDPEMLCCCLFAQFPGVDAKSVISFVMTIYTLRDLLEDFRRRKKITEETEIRSIFNCLSCAVDPSSSSICAINHTVKNAQENMQNSDNIHASDGFSGSAISPVCLSNQCRLQLAILPSYKLIAAKIKKYMQLYVDLQSYRHYPAPISEKILGTWSGSYLSRYQKISGWEFCTSADSFLGIAAMYAAATRPGITVEEVAVLDEACFPWLSGLSSLLKSMIRYRVSAGDGGLNFTYFYRNLKECEERILHFAAEAESLCMKLKEGKSYAEFIKTMTCLYLSDPEANFGMLRLTTENILKKYSLKFHCKAFKLARSLRLLSPEYQSADPG